MKTSVNYFQYFDGLGYVTIPVIPAKGPATGYAAKSDNYLGKAPGFFDEAIGMWRGFSGWQDYQATQQDLVQWHDHGANVGLVLGEGLIAIDIDASNEAVAEKVEKMALEALGPSPCRIGRPPRRLLMYRLTEPHRYRAVTFDQGGEKEKIEFLTKKKQIVVAGIHAKTGRGYAWPRMPVARAELTEVTPAQIERLIDDIKAVLPAAADHADRDSVDRGRVNQEALKGIREHVIAAIEALPNNREIFPDRMDYIRVGAALKASLEDENEAFELWCEWAAKDNGGKPELWGKDWRGITPPYAVGAFYLYNLAAQHGGWKGLEQATVETFSDPAGFEEAKRIEAAKEEAKNHAPLFPEESPNPFEKPPISLTPLRQFDPKTLPRRQWLYGNHYIRKYVSATAAPSAVGKSSMTMVEALAMATGKPLLGVQPKGTFRVWIWNGEDPLEELELRIAAAMRHYGLTWEDLGDRVFLDSGRVMPVVLATSGKQGAQIAVPVVEGVIAGMKANAIDVAIMDPFVSTFSGPETNEMFEPIVKKWGFIAGATNASVELVHHTRKLNGAETGVEDMRGGGALVAGARAKRVLARMSAAEAKKFGVREDDHRRFFRVADASVNMALPAVSGTTWFEMKGVPVGNGEGEGPLADMTGDQVGVATLRTLASTSNEMDETTVERIKDALRGGEWRENFRSNAWAGFAVADVMGLDPKEDRSEIDQTLREMKAMNAIRIDRRTDKNGNKVPFVVVVEADNTSGEMDRKSENPFD